MAKFEFPAASVLAAAASARMRIRGAAIMIGLLGAAVLLALSTRTAVTAGVSTTPDSFEGDNDSADASYIGIDYLVQSHNIHVEFDVDWVVFAAESIEDIEIRTFGLAAQSDTLITLYDSELTLVDLGGNNPNDDCGGIGPESCITFKPAERGVFFVKIEASPDASIIGRVGFGPDSDYDVLVDIPDAPCFDGCTTFVTGVVEDPGASAIPGATVEVFLQDASAFTRVGKSFPADSLGVYTKCGLGAVECLDPMSSPPGTPYVFRVSADGFPTHVQAKEVFRCSEEDGAQCFDNLLNFTLNQSNLGTVEVDFGRGEFEVSDGTVDAEYRTLQQGLLAAQTDAVIILQPGSTTETFTGGGVISQSVDLVNANPGGGPVIIGAASKRRAVQGRAEVKAGFVSRP